MTTVRCQACTDRCKSERLFLTLAFLVVRAGVEAGPDIIVLRHIFNCDLGPQLVPAKPTQLHKARSKSNRKVCRQYKERQGGLLHVAPVQHFYKVRQVLFVNICQYSKGLACMYDQQSFPQWCLATDVGARLQKASCPWADEQASSPVAHRKASCMKRPWLFSRAVYMTSVVPFCNSLGLFVIIPCTWRTT